MITATRLTGTVVRELDELDDLAPEWAELYAAAPTATPFQTHAWLTGWARHYSRDGRLRVVTVRRAGRLVAAAPLHLVRRGPVSVLAPVGGDVSDITDVLAADGMTPEVAAALTMAVLAEPGWTSVDLGEVVPGSAAAAWAEHWPGRRTVVPSSVCLELPVLPVEELLARVPSRTARTLRKKLRQSAEAGIEVGQTAADDVPAAVAMLVRLHEEQWRGRGGNPEHLTARFAGHLSHALTRMVADGQASIVQWSLAGELVAAQVRLIGHDALGFYLAGVAPRLRAQVDVSSMLVRDDVATALDLGLARYSLLRGTEDYKYRWRPEAVQQQRMVLGRPGALAAGHGLSVRARATAVALVKRHLPQARRWRDTVRTWVR